MVFCVVLVAMVVVNTVTFYLYIVLHFIYIVFSFLCILIWSPVSSPQSSQAKAMERPIPGKLDIQIVLQRTIRLLKDRS